PADLGVGVLRLNRRDVGVVFGGVFDYRRLGRRRSGLACGRGRLSLSWRGSILPHCCQRCPKHNRQQYRFHHYGSLNSMGNTFWESCFYCFSVNCTPPDLVTFGSCFGMLGILAWEETRTVRAELSARVLYIPGWRDYKYLSPRRQAATHFAAPYC